MENKSYIILTLHRPSNVDQKDHLKNILKKIIVNTKNIPIIFPAHPRTSKQLGYIKLA